MVKLMGPPQLPLLAIFPGDRPNQPIILKTMYRKKTVVEKLNEAGPSRNLRLADASSDEHAVNSTGQTKVATALP